MKHVERHTNFLEISMSFAFFQEKFRTNLLADLQAKSV